MTEKKMTIREGFEKARDHYAELGDTEMVEFFEGRIAQVADIVKNCPACEGMSVQKVSALLRQLVADGVLTVTEDKRKHFYSLAE